MAIIASIDGPNRLIYLHADTHNASVHPVDIYKEMRTFRRTDEDLRKYDVFLQAYGNVAKGGGKFTERYVVCIDGTRIIPYDQDGYLTITGTIITDDGQEGIACFDRSGLASQVDINYIPPQVEIIEVIVGSAVTPQDIIDISNASATATWFYDLTGFTGATGTAGHTLVAIASAGGSLTPEQATWLESIFESTDKKLLTKALWLALKS